MCTIYVKPLHPWPALKFLSYIRSVLDIISTKSNCYMAPPHDEADDVVEQTLGQFRDVSLYKIPPRSGASGHKSGSWLLADKVFTGRLRVISRNEECEIQMIDVSRCFNVSQLPRIISSVPQFPAPLTPFYSINHTARRMPLSQNL